MSETVQVVTDLPKPSFFKRIPTKQLVVTTVLVVSTVAFAMYAKNQGQENGETGSSEA